MKKHILFFALLLSLLSACGTKEPAGAQPPTMAATPETTVPETTVPETTIPQTLPQPETPPMYFPAMDNGQYIFGIELFNGGEYPSSITSMAVTDFLEDTLIRETALTTTQIQQANGDRPAKLELLPGTSSVEFLQVRPEDVDFDRRVLTVTTTDTQGAEVTCTVEYTMDESKATPRLHPDAEKWIAPFLRSGSVDFPCVIRNTTDETLYLKVYNAQCYLDCVPLRTRTETQFAKLNLQQIAQLEPGETALWTHSWPSSYRWTHRKDTLIYEDSQGNTYPMVYRFTGIPENPKSDAVIDAYLHFWGISDQRQLTVPDIETMLAQELTLEETARQISTIADLWQYLYIKEYKSSGGDLKFSHEGTTWHAAPSAQAVFRENTGNSGGTSALANRLLEGDYDGQGYILESGSQGGHIYNYFLKDGLYYVVDFTQTPYYGMNRPYQYQIPIVTELQEFSDAYTAGKNLILQYSVPLEGSAPLRGGSPMCCLSDEMEGNIRVLYQRDESTAPRFLPAPPKEIWPVDALE